MTGIDYPTITVGEHKDLTVRMSLAAQLLMRRRGIDPAQIGTLCGPITRPNPNMRLQTDPATITIPNPDGVKNIVTIFACMVAENFLDLSKPNTVDLNAAPTADYWAIKIDDFGEVETAVWGAVGKAVEERRKRLQVVPPQQEAAS
jgi:hypothetical protein